MLKIATLLVGGLITLSNLFSQNYISFRNYLNEGNYWFYEQRYDSALVYYEQSEQFNLTFFPAETHLYSRTLWEVGQKEKSIAILLKSGKSDFFKRDTTFYLGLSPIEREKILAQLPQLNSEISNERFELYSHIEKWDQIYRNKLRVTQNEDSIRIYQKLIRYQDSVNFVVLMKDIQENGYPDGYTFVGIGLGSLLLHTNPTTLINNYAIFMSEIESGRMNLYDFARAFDRIFTTPENQNHKPYNTYFPLDSTQIDSPELVFINRCSIGMSPYYDTYAPMVLKRGITPPKSKLYDYYKRKKEDFNCIKIK